MKACIKEGD